MPYLIIHINIVLNYGYLKYKNDYFKTADKKIKKIMIKEEDLDFLLRVGHGSNIKTVQNVIMHRMNDVKLEKVKIFEKANLIFVPGNTKVNIKGEIKTEKVYSHSIYKFNLKK